MEKQQKRMRAKTTKSRQPEIGQPIFTDEISNIIPGEVIIQLRPETGAQITESIPTGPSRGHSKPGPARFGVPGLDRVLADLKVTSITRLTPPAPTMTAADESLVALASTFKVRFESKTQVETAVESLSKIDGVEYAEPNRYRETSSIPNDPDFPNQWGLSKINCPDAWNRTTGSANVVVAVLDTGIDLDHPELKALLVNGRDMVDFGPNPIPPLGFRFEGDFQGRDNDPQDEIGHGTHVAGTIACASNNATGVAGVTWSCRLLPVKVLTRIVSIADPNDVRGLGGSADLAAGIRYAVDQGARVLNLSLGSDIATNVEQVAIAYAISKGAVVVAAMGNGFRPPNPNRPSFPAAYPDVVAVGAINWADQRAAFSQTGPHIDVVAPGVDVLSTMWDNGYATSTGTSMATPHVSGVAALILSCNPNLTGAQVANIIRQSARPLRDNPADPVPNENYGWGCVDARAAIDRACPFDTIKKSQLIPCRSKIVVECVLPKTTPPIICQSRICTSKSAALCGEWFYRYLAPGDKLTKDPYLPSAEDWTAFDPYALWYEDAD